MLKRVILAIIAIGVILGIVQLFGGNVFGAISWGFDWIVYSIDKLANTIAGNDTMQKAFHTRPSDIAGIASITFWRF